MEAVLSDIIGMKDAIKTLENENASLKKQVKKMNAKFSHIEAVVDDARQELNTGLTVVNQSTEMLTRLQRTFNQLHFSLQSKKELEHEVKQLREEMDEVKNMSPQHQPLQGAASSQSDGLRPHRAQRERVPRTTSDDMLMKLGLTGKMEAVLRDVIGMKDAIKVLETENTSLKKQVNKMNKKFSDMQTIVDGARQELSTGLTMVNQRTETIHRLQRTFNQLHFSLQSKKELEEEVMLLREEMDEVKEQSLLLQQQPPPLPPSPPPSPQQQHQHPQGATSLLPGPLPNQSRAVAATNDSKTSVLDDVSSALSKIIEKKNELKGHWNRVFNPVDSRPTNRPPQKATSQSEGAEDEHKAHWEKLGNALNGEIDSSPSSSQQMSAGTTSTRRDKSKTDEDEEAILLEKSLSARSKNHMLLSGGRRIHITHYDHKKEDIVSDVFNPRTGIYSTTRKNAYSFIIRFKKEGDGNVDWYLCGSDGKTEMLTNAIKGEKGWFCKRVDWVCGAYTEVWIEVQADVKAQISCEFTAGMKKAVDAAMMTCTVL